MKTKIFLLTLALFTSIANSSDSDGGNSGKANSDGTGGKMVCLQSMAPNQGFPIKSNSDGTGKNQQTTCFLIKEGKILKSVDDGTGYP